MFALVASIHVKNFARVPKPIIFQIFFEFDFYEFCSYGEICALEKYYAVYFPNRSIRQILDSVILARNLAATCEIIHSHVPDNLQSEWIAGMCDVATLAYLHCPLQTVIRGAMNGGNIEILEHLAKEHPQDPLIDAEVCEYLIARGHEDTFISVIEGGFNLSENSQHYCFITACSIGSIKIVRYMMKKFECNVRAGMMEACERGMKTVAEFLGRINGKRCYSRCEGWCK